MKQNNKVFFLDPPLQSDRLHEQVLCDEWRKVQSSATLFELNPGVGCWTTHDGNGSAAELRTLNSSQPNTPARVAFPAPSTAASVKNEESA